jgi:hypothetical protein
MLCEFNERTLVFGELFESFNAVAKSRAADERQEAPANENARSDAERLAPPTLRPFKAS